ncbi:MAG: oligosaccharide repeat unit polymerase [Mesorhizobium sp.]|uniref:O-antigen polymerase n=1 Tax=Mesorhizobium sp. TaxID=1871066 RepID=UPI001212FC7A|nr:O-antigen polymerase [Mesorhizobium sp.]TIL62938.1 MAG: oligosaccharide repeat unit polymerase [Mesorhizobium sp.]
MAEAVSFLILLVTTCGILIGAFIQPHGYLKLPPLCAAVYGGWLLPQLWQLRGQLGNLDATYLAILNLFFAACLFSVHIGWHWGVRAEAYQLARIPVRVFASQRDISRVTGLVTLVAWSMWIAMGMRSLDERNETMWSGPLTIMYFFLNLKMLSMFLSTYLLLRFKSRVAVLLFLANAALYFPLVLVYFRRRAMLELFIALSLAFWFARRAVLPRVGVLLGMPVGTIVVFAVGALRGLARGDGTLEWRMPSFADISAIDFWSLTPFVSDQQSPEVTNAFYLVRLSSELGYHTFGASSWNRLVFQWVPAQIVGADLKNALMIDADVGGALVNTFNYSGRTGSTSTAMAQAYVEFGPFGIVFFVATAYVLARWWVRANRGSVWAMTLYACALPLAVIMPTSYPIVVLNFMLLYGGALWVTRFMMTDSSSEWRHQRHVGRGYCDVK